MIVSLIVAGFFTAIGWHYGDKFVKTHLDTPETKMEKKVDTDEKPTNQQRD